MIRENLYEAFTIVYKTLDVCPKTLHSHNFYEVIYITEGSGIQSINGQEFKYHADHLFLLAPEDLHEFKIEQTTTFFFLRFNTLYLKDSGLSEKCIEQLGFILQSANQIGGCILKNKMDKQVVKPLIEAIIREHLQSENAHQELIQQYVNTLILLVGRNIVTHQELDAIPFTESKIIQIIGHIQKNIFYPELLKVDFLSAQFNLSERYFGRYFKKHIGQSLQQYIADYKLKMIEQRLLYSDKRVGEIAEEFNFVDESHFNKFFKRVHKIAPSVYRKQGIMLTSTL